MATIMLKKALNSATLRARRQHSRAILAAAQPWLTIAVVTAALEFGLFGYALFHNNFRTLSLIESLLQFVFGFVSLIAGIRSWLYERSHPLDLPEPQTALRWD